MSAIKKASRHFSITFISVVSCITLTAVLLILNGSGTYSVPRDSRIIGDICQIRTLIPNTYINEGSYDSFSCLHKDIALFCREISDNYVKEDGNKPTPIITHDTSINSQAVCIYSPLNKEEGWLRKKKFWYCTDSKGHVGYTSIDPGSDGYCVEGKSAVCPPVSKEIP